jgi:hypothetical protein
MDKVEQILLVQAVTHVICIVEVPTLNLGWDIDYPG